MVATSSVVTAMQLETLLSEPRSLPTVPDIGMRLIATFDEEDVDAMQVAQDISLDPVLTAKLLKQANSAFFGLSRSVTTAKDAMSMLGLNKVRALVIASVLEDCFSVVPGMKLEQFWRYSMNTATLARLIARATGNDENTAFTVGLIHGIGELVMHVGMPEAMDLFDMNIEPLAIKRAAAEKEHFGYCYAEVGAGLARSWKFPKSMIQAIEFQLTPFAEGIYEPMAAILHLASWRARAAELKLGGDHLINTYPDEVGIVLGVDPDLIMEAGDDLPA